MSPDTGLAATCTNCGELLGREAGPDATTCTLCCIEARDKEFRPMVSRKKPAPPASTENAAAAGDEAEIAAYLARVKKWDAEQGGSR